MWIGRHLYVVSGRDEEMQRRQVEVGALKGVPIVTGARRMSQQRNHRPDEVFPLQSTANVGHDKGAGNVGQTSRDAIIHSRRSRPGVEPTWGWIRAGHAAKTVWASRGPKIPAGLRRRSLGLPEVVIPASGPTIRLTGAIQARRRP